MNQQFAIGQKVLWRGSFGGDPEVPATIVGFGSKNGRTVVDLDKGPWAYLSQIRPLGSAGPNVGTW